MTSPEHGEATTTPAQFWEARYADTGPVWSGRANPSLVAIASDLTPGAALDLGCGEGGDAIWLAARGWNVTGIDISPTAVTRAQAAAADAGIPTGQITFEAADLATWTGSDSYDLVTASFFQSPVDLPRAEVLRRVADLVAPGGHLLVVSHARPPIWATEHQDHEGHHFLTPSEEIDALDLDPEQWEVQVAEIRERETSDPDDGHAAVPDSIVLLKRHR